jgi:hypothetical protein
MANWIKISLSVIIVVLLTSSFSNLLAVWQCPCFKVECVDDTIEAGFCLRTETLDNYYFWLGNEEQGYIYHIALAPEVLNDCDTGCTYYYGEIEWDCDEPYIWCLTFGLYGDPIEFDPLTQECY